MYIQIIIWHFVVPALLEIGQIFEISISAVGDIHCDILHMKRFPIG